MQQEHAVCFTFQSLLFKLNDQAPNTSLSEVLMSRSRDATAAKLYLFRSALIDSKERREGKNSYENINHGEQRRGL